MKKEIKFAISNNCFRCNKPIVEMTDEKMREAYGGAPVTAVIHAHYVTPWGPACEDCLPQLRDKWMEYTNLKK